MGEGGGAGIIRGRKESGVARGGTHRWCLAESCGDDRLRTAPAYGGNCYPTDRIGPRRLACDLDKCLILGIHQSETPSIFCLREKILRRPLITSIYSARCYKTATTSYC